MDYFHTQQHALYAEQVALSEIAAQYGTPCYVYSKATLVRHYQAYDQALGQHPHLICYAVKANSNLSVLAVLAELGSGFDIVSGGELERVLAAGGDPGKIVFSGVGKQAWEIQRALAVGIHCFNVESEQELDLINQLAGEAGQRAPISIRVNPDVDAQTHPYISTGLKDNKFGIDIQRAREVYLQAAGYEHLAIKGVDCHIGSQLTSLSPYADSLERVMELVHWLETQGIKLQHIDLGGGLGVPYHDETPPEPQALVNTWMQVLGDTDYTVMLEPGRSIAANAGVLLTTVQFIKDSGYKNFALVDAAMNDLLRPSLYNAWQAIEPVIQREGTTSLYDVVGPVCETGDFLGKDRELVIQAGDVLAVKSAGAYGFVMSSNYNTRPMVAEVMVDGSQARLIRPRQTVQQLFAAEQDLL